MELEKDSGKRASRPSPTASTTTTPTKKYNKEHNNTEQAAQVAERRPRATRELFRHQPEQPQQCGAISCPTLGQAPAQK